MSWNVDLVIDTGGESLRSVCEVGNYTFNVSKMYYDVFKNGFREDLHGVSAYDCIFILEKAIEKLKANPEKYKAMNPENGWGNYEGAISFLEAILSACKENPKCTVRIL